MFDLKTFYDLSEAEIVEHFLPVKDMKPNILEEIVLYNDFYPILLRNEDPRFFDYIAHLSSSSQSFPYLLASEGKVNWVFGDNWDKVPDSLKIKGVETATDKMSEEVAFALLVWFIENYQEVKPKITANNFYSSVVFYNFSDEFRSTLKYQEMLENFSKVSEVFKTNGYTQEQNWVEKQKAREEATAALAWLKKDASILDSLELKSSYFRACADLVVQNNAPEHYKWVRDYICQRYLNGDKLNNFHTFSFQMLLNIFLDEEVPLEIREFIDEKEKITKSVSSFSEGKFRLMVDHLNTRKWSKLLELFPSFKESLFRIFIEENTYIPPILYSLLFAEAEKYIDDDYQFSNILIPYDSVYEHGIWMMYKRLYKNYPRYRQLKLTAEAKDLVGKYFGQKIESSSPEHIFSLLKTIVVEKMMTASS